MPELTKNAKPAGGAYFKNILSILFFDFVYGWYLTGRSNSVHLSTIDFLCVKQSKPSFFVFSWRPGARGEYRLSARSFS